MKNSIWETRLGDGPLVATAIHDGHDVRDDVRPRLRVSDSERFREEDPFTGEWAALAPTSVVGTHSRFEVDLNRPRDKAVYITPDDAWGIEVWNDTPSDDIVSSSLESYDAFYAAFRGLAEELVRKHGRFVVLDLHSYNHRRSGPAGAAADPLANPQVNIGTGTMTDRKLWAPLIDRFVADVSDFSFPGGGLDIRENIRFRGGNFAAEMHRDFPGQVCMLSVEVKKFFMDEWTGQVDRALHGAVGQAFAAAVPGLLEELSKL